MTPYSIIKYIKWKIAKFLCKKEAYDWFIAISRNKDFKNGQIIPLDEYSKKKKRSSIAKKRVVCIYDGKIAAFGLADRLRGIISTFIICERYNYEFKILFSDPFPLERYLIPKQIDWRITANELNYNLEETDICLIDSMNGNAYEAQKQERWFINELKKDYKEFHIRTNAHFSYNYDYAEYFSKLFTPSPLLIKLMTKHTEILGNNYISTSFRFLDLLGDFNETNKIGYIISNRERKALINSNIEQLKQLYWNNPCVKILVNSDSRTFLNEANKLEFTYIIPGDISHIDSGDKVDVDTHDKTFTDFYMIANAAKIYLFKTGKMHNSGFPYAAALLYRKPFEKIEF